MFGLSAGELILVGMIVFLVFGWAWVPRIGERVGALFGGVKEGMREDDERIVVRQATPTKKDDDAKPGA
jgi:Sec-independent protein translocase protein TatA